MYTGDDGTFDIADVPIQIGVNRTLNARLQDGSRSAAVTVQVNDAHPAPVTMTLSSLGNARFTVLDTLGNPVIGLRVELLVGAGFCSGITGIQMTDANGQVTFHDVKLGTVAARAFAVGGTFVDLATGTALVTAEGQTGIGVLKFKGAGSVTGTVYFPNGSPAQGAEVTLQSNRYDERTCQLTQGESHRVTTGPSGQFNFIGVNIGSVGVTTSHPFLTTQVGAQGTLNHDGDSVT